MKPAHKIMREHSLNACRNYRKLARLFQGLENQIQMTILLRREQRKLKNIYFAIRCDRLEAELTQLTQKRA